MFDPGPSEPTDALPLPFHIPTIARDLLRRWPLVFVILIIGATAGIGAALTLASRTYQSELILQYKPLAACTDDFCEDSPPSLSTLLNRVKTPASLALIRQELQWESTLRELGASITAFSDGGSDLLIIRGDSDSSQKALDLVQAIEVSFLQQRQQELARARIREIQRRLSSISQRRLSVDAQLQTMNEQIETYQGMADRERQDITNNNPTVAILQREILIENLQQDRDLRLANLELDRAQRAYARAQQLAQTNAIPVLQVEEARQALHQAEIFAEDIRTDPEFQAQFQRLERAALSGRNTLTPSDHLLLAVLHRSIAVELDAVELAETEAHLALALQSMSSTNLAPSFDVENTGFEVISPARLQPRPTSSNRRLIAVFVASLIAILGLGILLLRLLLWPRIRSSAEFEYLFGLPLIATFGANPAEPAPLHTALASRLIRTLSKTDARALLIAPVEDHIPSPITAADLTPHLLFTLPPPQVVQISSASDLITPDHHRDDSTPLLLIGPPILGTPTLDLLATSIDGVVLLVSSSSTSRRQIRGALSRLQKAQLSCLGVILSDVHPTFLLPEDQLLSP